jgi:hypothetical protein
VRAGLGDKQPKRELASLENWSATVSSELAPQTGLVGWFLHQLGPVFTGFLMQFCPNLILLKVFGPYLVLFFLQNGHYSTFIYI